MRQFVIITGSKFSESLHVLGQHSGSLHCGNKSFSRSRNKRFDFISGLLGPRTQVNLSNTSNFMRQRLRVPANVDDLLYPSGRSAFASEGGQVPACRQVVRMKQERLFGDCFCLNS